VLGGLEDYLLLHLLNVSSFFAFVWLPPQVGLSSPTASRGAVASGFVLVGYLLEVACDIFVPEVVTVLAPLLEVGALISRVPHVVAEFAVFLREGLATHQGNVAYE